MLAGALERFGDGPGAFFLARFVNELLKPVTMVPLRVEIAPVAMGRQVQRLEAKLYAGDVVVARATGLRIRRRAVAVPVPDEPRMPGPDGFAETPFTFFTVDLGYHRAVEARITRGTWGAGPVAGWMRARVPLVAGEPTRPWERVVSLADAESGLCPPLAPGEFTFLNPDLAVTLDREPEGEWVGLDVRSVARPHGVGIAESALYDQRGPFGRSVQTLIIEPRAG